MVVISDVAKSTITVRNAVTVKRKLVTASKGRLFNACFPSTVELPQQNADSKASSDAIIALSFHTNVDVMPNVTK